MHMEPSPGWNSAWLIAASFIAGALNAVAGGGSFFSFPALLGMRVLPIQANATNTVALWPGQVTSIAGYLADLKVNVKLLLPVASAALLGGLSGAVVLLHTGQATFMTLVPWLLLFATGLFAISTPVSRWVLNKSSRQASGQPKKNLTLPPLWIGVAFVSLYIGYFGAGSGFLIMSVLALFGIEQIREINALKVVATTVANGIAVVTFIAARRILWRYCVPMMLAAAIGGFLGARFSRRLNPRYLRLFVIIVGLGMSAYFFWKDGNI
jgi:uncharacterized protein